MKRFAQFNIFVFLFLCHSIAAAAVDSAEVVSVRPGAYITIEAERLDAAVGQDVFHGNRLETDKHGRMSLLLPDHKYENRLDWNAAYFYKNLLFFNLHAFYKNIRPKSDARDQTEEKSFTIEPEIEIYLLSNKLQLNLTGHLELRNTENGPNEDNNTIRWIRTGIAYYF